MVPLNSSLALALLIFTALPHVSPQVSTEAAAVTFVASTPCDKQAKALKAIPADADCEFMKWKLTLYNDPASKAPAKYKLSCTYGMTRPNTNGFTNGASLEMQGKWTITKGSAVSTAAIVYQLIPAAGGQPLHFVKLHDDLLHLLDSEKRLMVGNPGWSYTFNKVNQTK